MKWKVLLIVALLAGGGLAVGASLGVLGASPTATGTNYLTAQAAVGDVTAQVAATGSVAPASTWGLSFGSAAHVAVASGSGSNTASPSVTWPVSVVKAAVGQQVRKGDALAIAGTGDLDSQIADANLALSTAGIQLSQAKSQLKAATTTTTQQQAQIGLNNARTGYARALKTVDDLKAMRPLATLTAPSDGIITAVSISVGADAPSGDAIQIAATPLEVTTSVVEKDVAAISAGQPADVTISALGATLQGTVVSIAPAGSSSGNGGVVSFAVEIALADTPAGLRPGMTADVTITTASATGVLAIPARALLGTAAAYRVRVLNADGSVATRDVTVGLVTDTLVEIKSGLQAGDRVITGTSSAQNGATNGGTVTNGRGFPGGGVQFRGPGG